MELLTHTFLFFGTCKLILVLVRYGDEIKFLLQLGTFLWVLGITNPVKYIVKNISD